MSRALLTTLLCAALLAACGGSDDSPGTGGDASSGAQRFVADGDKLCRRLAERYPRVRAERRGTQTSPASVLKAASAYREFARELSSGLAALDAPDDANARTILSMSSRLAARALEQKRLQQRVLAAKQGGDLNAAFRAALSAARAEQKMMRDIAQPLDKRLRSYGFDVCGRPQSFGAPPAQR